MKAKKIVEILLKNPEAEVTLSVSNDKIQIFADNIIEITQQGEKQLTIVADINENYLLHNVNKRGELLIDFCDKIIWVEERLHIHTDRINKYLKGN